MIFTGIANAGLVDSDDSAAEHAVMEWRRALSLAPGERPTARNLAAFYRALSEAGKLELVGIDLEGLKARLYYLER